MIDVLFSLTKKPGKSGAFLMSGRVDVRKKDESSKKPVGHHIKKDDALPTGFFVCSW